VWRKQFEAEQKEKFKELGDAVKMLNGNIAAMETDSSDRFEMAVASIKTSQNALGTQIEDLNAKVMKEEAYMEERVTLIIEQLNQKLQNKLERSVLDQSSMLGQLSELMKKKMIENNKLVLQQAEENVERAKKVLTKENQEQM